MSPVNEPSIERVVILERAFEPPAALRYWSMILLGSWACVDPTVSNNGREAMQQRNRRLIAIYKNARTRIEVASGDRALAQAPARLGPAPLADSSVFWPTARRPLYPHSPYPNPLGARVGSHRASSAPRMC